VRSALWVLVAAIVLLSTATAHAHAVGLSRGSYAVGDGKVDAELTFARADVVALVPALDANQDGVLSQSAIDKARPEIAKATLGGLAVSADGSPCSPHLVAANLTEQDGLEIRGTYDCPRGARNVHFTLTLLDELGAGHRHLVHAEGASTVVVVCFRGQADFDVAARGEGKSAGSSPQGPKDAETGAEPRRTPSWVQFFTMGIEHILTGYDHLVFLFGLVLVGGRLRGIIAVITAFTLAHSITLALATLGVWAPSPRIVEPAIALSIAYVGVENFFVTTAERRWRITFPFGLIHGFGFAGALREIGLPRAQVPEALVLFNMGVETGQLAVLALVLPLIYWLRRFEWFRGRAVRVLSAAVALAGLAWFVSRVRG
jgi:hydrogenase/urease accessory protein HupE